MDLSPLFWILAAVIVLYFAVRKFKELRSVQNYDTTEPVILEVKTGFLDELKKPEKGWSIVAVVGESFKNSDGTQRQKIIKKLRTGDAVTLLAEKNNPHSKTGFAVAVYTAYGQIGHIGEKDECQEWIFKNLTDGKNVSARVLNIIGGTEGRPSKGVWLEIKTEFSNERYRKNI